MEPFGVIKTESCLDEKNCFYLDGSWLEVTDEQLQTFLSDRYGNNQGNQVCFLSFIAYKVSLNDPNSLIALSVSFLLSST